MPDLNPDPISARAAGLRRFLTFRMEESLYALPAEDVSEVIRVPAVARLPQAPKGLLGVANLRGSVLPVASLRGLLGRDEAGAAHTSRAIVLDDGAAPLALVVDAVDALLTVEADRIETRQAELAAEPGERLQGAFRDGPDHRVAKILDLRGLVGAALAQRPSPDRRRQPHGNLGAGAARQDEEAGGALPMLVTFDVAGQEYALGLDAVQEVMAAPRARAAVPGVEARVLGVSAFRDTLLPLLSLRGLLGFAPAEADGREKVIVATVSGVLVGLVADRMRAVVPADPRLMEPLPPALAARTGGEARVKAIYRGEGGRRLISILAPEQLFREDVMQRLEADRDLSRAEGAEAGRDRRDEIKVLVFRLGQDEFALPVEAVDEVARVPERITRVPKTPAFLEGVVNLRGEVLPVVDQRRRFHMPALEGSRARRLVVVRTERHRAGLIVDSVSEVLRTSPDSIGHAPDLTGEATRLVHGVINLESVGRLVLLLDPAELLSRAERGLLDDFEAEAAQANL